ncbi:MAG: arginine--tRNA ligase [Candidatus Daviesbacteria bacterium]|nr:arginine--tRNA ligase [Candidatus Daviesbacteria bacterium]
MTKLMIKQQLEEDLRKTIKSLGYESDDPLLSIPQKSQLGDYSTNIALQLPKQKPQNNHHSSQEIAKEILDELGNLEYLQKAEIAGPGFLNFWLRSKYLANDLKIILSEGDDFGKSKANLGKKARVEYVSANPTGPLHIGNARGGPLGDVVANCLESQGFKVTREYIHNDVGEQVKRLGATIKATLAGGIEEENQYKGEYVKELADKLKGEMEGKSDEQVGQMAVNLLFEEIMADVSDMGIKFDLVVKESELRNRAKEVIEELKSSGVTKEKDGALWLAPSDEFLKDRETVVVKSDGGYTYFTSDIVYHKDKFESQADLIIDVFGSNHHGHIPRLQAAMKGLGFDTQKLKFILYQYVRVKKGDEILKMSKRAGTFISAREVLDEVGKDSFRFSLLNFSPETHIDFDLELYKSQSNKNPVFYVQYAHARMANILIKTPDQPPPGDLSTLETSQELALIKHLLEFPSLVSEVARSFEVHKLTFYAICLADLFHKFYEKCPVLNAETENLKLSRINLVKASKITLGSTLALLGIKAPERM